MGEGGGGDYGGPGTVVLVAAIVGTLAGLGAFVGGMLGVRGWLKRRGGDWSVWGGSMAE